MTDTPGASPRTGADRLAPARDPPAGRGRPGRALHVASGDSFGRADTGAGGAGRSAIVECPLGRVPRGRRRHPLRGALLVLRARRPAGLTEPRLEAEIIAQQITKVERGYNVYQANCARCHGAQGEGGIGTVLNQQDKLFSHLNENYIRNVLTAGGRYVCGDRSRSCRSGPTRASRQARSTTARSTSSSRTSWRPTSRPTSSATSTCSIRRWTRSPGKVYDVHGLARSELRAGAGRNAVSRLLEGCAHHPGGSAAPSAGASTDPNAQVVTVTASNIAFDPTDGDRPGRYGVHAVVRQPGCRHPPRRPGQGRVRYGRVQDGRVPRRREARLPGAGAGGRHISVRLLGAPQHDGNPDRGMIDGRPARPVPG